MAEKILTFGEIMLRLSTPDHYTINQTHSFMVNYGGGEANVAVALAHMGHKAYFMSKLPPNQLGDGAITHLKGNGVDTSYIVRGSSTIGIYFLETGFGGRPSKVIYNRKHSAITRIQENEFNWDEIFTDATWFHLSGITLALGERVRKVALRAVIEAKKHNVPVSFDFNYRSKLWTVEEARPVYKEFMNYVNIVFASFYDANTILEIPLDEGFENSTLSEKRRNVFPKMIKKYNLHYIFGTDRVVFSSTENSLAGYYFSLNGDELSWELTDPIRFNIYDRIGGGDAFASGVIHGLLLDYNNPQYAVRYGLNTSVLKHTIYGDAFTMSCEDIETFMAANGSAEVVR
ncbi:MAG: sugar kinase [Anaeroplasma sp.]|nr:sugar kinase [Anaeroplasma sp.]